MSLKIGFIGIIGDEWKEDPEGTLAWVAELGFDGVEGAAPLAGHFGLSVPEFREKLAAHGLAASVQGSVNRDQSDEERRAVMTRAKEVGAAYVVDYFAPFNTREEILEYAEFANQAGGEARDEGLAFLYHNHNQEFRSFDGVTGLELLLKHTDPSLVKVELDVGWVTFGGADPVAVIRNDPDRYPVLHIKDFETVPSEDPSDHDARKAAIFTEVGEGVLNLTGVVAAARDAGVEWLNIEQDRMNTRGPRASLETSFRNLKAVVG